MNSKAIKRISFEASRIAPEAARLLADWEGLRVFQIFPGGLNFTTCNREIFTVQLAGLEMGPLSAEIINPDMNIDLASLNFIDLVETHSPVSCAQDQFQIGPVQISLADAKSWDPRPDWAALRESPRYDKEIFYKLGAWLRNNAPPGSLAPLARFDSPKGKWGKIDPDGSSIDTILLIQAAAPANSLLNALAESDLPRVRDAAAALAGLGRGLTPSGDDFLIGGMYALWGIWNPDRAGRWAQAISDSAAPRTTFLSRAYLKVASRGEAGEYWRDFVNAIASGNEREMVKTGALIIGKGQTSGADALAGFLVTGERLAFAS